MKHFNECYVYYVKEVGWLKLRKDDPIYYRNKINGLIREAFNNGLKIETKISIDKTIILFKADNGDIAEVALKIKK